MERCYYTNDDDHDKKNRTANISSQSNVVNVLNPYFHTTKNPICGFICEHGMKEKAGIFCTTSRNPSLLDLTHC